MRHGDRARARAARTSATARACGSPSCTTCSRPGSSSPTSAGRTRRRAPAAGIRAAAGGSAPPRPSSRAVYTNVGNNHVCATVTSAYNSRPRRTGTALRATDHLRRRSGQDLCVGLPGAQGRRPRDPPRRDLRAARAERRRQDHADQHHLRHRQRRPPARSRPTATTSCATTARRAPRSAWCRRS